MTPGSFRFDRFHLDPADRRLARDGETVELNARYLDALVLMVGEPGKPLPDNDLLSMNWYVQGVDDKLPQ